MSKMPSRPTRMPKTQELSYSRVGRRVVKKRPFKPSKSLHKQMRYRVRRLEKMLGLGKKRICDEAYVSYQSFNTFLRGERSMFIVVYDRLVKVIEHYEFFLELNETVEQARWRKLRKDKKLVYHKDD